MTPDERTTRIYRTVSAVLGVPASDLNDDSSPDNVEGWDSVNHLNIVMALEEAFNVSFSPEESLDINSVKLIRLLLEEKDR